MSHFPPEKENLWGGKKREKKSLGKIKPFLFFFFPPMQNRGTAASVSWGSPQPRAEQPQIPASRCLHRSSRGFGPPAAELSPAGAGRDSPHSSITSSRRGTNPAATDLLLQPNFGFISLLVLGQKVCFAGKFLTSLSWYLCVLHSHSEGCYLKKKSIIFQKGGKKIPSMQTVTRLCPSPVSHFSSTATGHSNGTRVCWKGSYWDAGKNNLLIWLSHCSARNGNIWTHNTLKDD